MKAIFGKLETISLTKIWRNKMTKRINQHRQSLLFATIAGAFAGCRYSGRDFTYFTGSG